MWTVVNTVYFDDGSNELYGYKIMNEEKTKRNIISSKTAKRLMLENKLKVSPRQELSFCTVSREFKETDEHL